MLIVISIFYFTFGHILIVVVCTEPILTHVGKFMFVAVHYKWVPYESRIGV